jgi:hypothetical protein
MVAMHAIRAGFFGGTLLAAFAPVSIHYGGGVASPTATCATCCPQEGATCVICGTQGCVTVAGYYEAKIGPGGCVNDM